MTENQYWFADYVYESSKECNNIIEKLLVKIQSEEEIPDADQTKVYAAQTYIPPDIEEEYKKFKVSVEKKIGKYAAHNLAFLDTYFKSRKGFKPRCCVKGIIDEIMIFDIKRGPGSPLCERFDLNENTAFDYIVNDINDEYLENNIPQKAKAKLYENNRLNKDNIANYKEAGFLKNIIYRFTKKPDNDWIKCWKIIKNKFNVTKAVDPRNCYKSTLVVPIKCTEDELNPKNGVMPKYLGIFGFYCIDSHNINYFDKDLDKYVVSIVAQYFSLMSHHKTLIDEKIKENSKLMKTKLNKIFLESPQTLTK